MLGVVITVAVIVILTGVIAWAVMRNRLRGVAAAAQTQSRAGSRAVNTALALTYIVFGLAIPLVFIIGNHDKSNAQVGGVKLTAEAQAGRQLFADRCAVCHTLAAVNAVGKVGPNLDVLRPTEAKVLTTIANGCVQQPADSDAADNCLGYGTMPGDVVQGRDAQDVAAFVAAVAGHT